EGLANLRHHAPARKTELCQARRYLVDVCNGRRPEEPDPFLGQPQQRIARGEAVAGKLAEQCVLGRGQLPGESAFCHSPLRTMANRADICGLVAIAFTGVALMLAACASHAPARAHSPA